MYRYKHIRRDRSPDSLRTPAVGTDTIIRVVDLVIDHVSS